MKQVVLMVNHVPCSHSYKKSEKIRIQAPQTPHPRICIITVFCTFQANSRNDILLTNEDAKLGKIKYLGNLMEDLIMLHCFNTYLATFIKYIEHKAEEDLPHSPYRDACQAKRW